MEFRISVFEFIALEHVGMNTNVFTALKHGLYLEGKIAFICYESVEKNEWIKKMLWKTLHVIQRVNY